MSIPSASRVEPLVPQIRALLEQAHAAVRAGDAKIAAARRELSEAKDEVRRYERLLSLCQSSPATGLSKASLRPLVIAALHDGPLPEGELLKRLKETLKTKGMSLNGLALVMRALRPELTTTDGRWTVRAGASPVADATTDRPRGKGGAA